MNKRVPKVSVVIPNYNGGKYNRKCLESLRQQTLPPDLIIVVDNGSTDGSAEEIERDFPEVTLHRFPENTGFTGAVNQGIAMSEGMDYCILLNNDTEAEPDFVRALVEAIGRRDDIFSCQAKMLKMSDPSVMDDAGDLYCSLGWAFARGKGMPETDFTRQVPIFSSCAGAAIYSMKLLKEIGLFDDNHFAYLEDTDIGWRARIRGFRNLFVPAARVRHVGSASSGSIYNLFKVKNTSRNSIYLIYKNMPTLQILLNLPFFVAGFGVKAVFFTIKGFGAEYIRGIGQGFALCRKGGAEGRRVRFEARNLPHYVRIQLELWVNVARRFLRR